MFDLSIKTSISDFFQGNNPIVLKNEINRLEKSFCSLITILEIYANFSFICFIQICDLMYTYINWQFIIYSSEKSCFPFVPFYLTYDVLCIYEMKIIQMQYLEMG